MDYEEKRKEREQRRKAMGIENDQNLDDESRKLQEKLDARRKERSERLSRLGVRTSTVDLIKAQDKVHTADSNEINSGVQSPPKPLSPIESNANLPEEGKKLSKSKETIHDREKSVESDKEELIEENKKKDEEEEKEKEKEKQMELEREREREREKELEREREREAEIKRKEEEQERERQEKEKAEKEEIEKQKQEKERIEKEERERIEKEERERIEKEQREREEMEEKEREVREREEEREREEKEREEAERKALKKKKEKEEKAKEEEREKQEREEREEKEKQEREKQEREEREEREKQEREEKEKQERELSVPLETPLDEDSYEARMAARAAKRRSQIIPNTSSPSSQSTSYLRSPSLFNSAPKPSPTKTFTPTKSTSTTPSTTPSSTDRRSSIESNGFRAKTPETPSKFEKSSSNSSTSVRMRSNTLDTKTERGGSSSSSPSSSDGKKPKINILVETCDICNKTVYPVDKIEADKKKYHKTCLKCCHCHKTLSLSNYASFGGQMYCKPHFKQLVQMKGNFDEVNKTKTLPRGFSFSGLTKSSFKATSVLDMSGTEKVYDKGTFNQSKSFDNFENVEEESEPPITSGALMRWCKGEIDEYPHVSVENFTTSWKSGLAFCALIHSYCPNLVDFNSLDPNNSKENLETAFLASDVLGVKKTLKVSDLDDPNESKIIDYLSELFKALSTLEK